MSESNDKRLLQEVALARLYCFLIALLHPGWAISMMFLLPDEFNDLVGRSTIGAIFAVLGILSYRFDKLKDNLPTVNQIGYSLFAIHWFWIVHASGMATIYIIGSLVVTFAFNAGFTSMRLLLVYSAVVIAGSIVASLTTVAPWPSKFMLVMAVCTSQLVGITFNYAKSVVLKELADAETATLLLQKRLLDKEMEVARAVQQNLLTPKVDLKKIGLETYYRSAGKTGGDWYGHYFDRSNNYLYLWIGDVTGHGVPSALVTGVACGALYSGEKHLDLHGKDVKPEARMRFAAQVVNEVIHENGGSMMMSMLFCGLNLDTGELIYVNAGHRFPFLLRPNDKLRQLSDAPNNILGFDKVQDFTVHKHQLEVGDTLFMYTDGLVENVGPDKKCLDKINLRRVLTAAIGSEEIISVVKDEAEKLWADTPINDDVTLLAVTWTPEANMKRTGVA